jgi:hypothetical protein
MRFFVLILLSLFLKKAFALNQAEFDRLILRNTEDEHCAEFLMQGNKTSVGTGVIVSTGGIQSMNKQQKLDLSLCIISINEIEDEFKEGDGSPLKCYENHQNSTNDVGKTGAFIAYNSNYIEPEIIIHKNSSIAVKEVLNHEVLHCLNYFSFKDLHALDGINGDLTNKHTCLMEKQKFEQKIHYLLKNKIRLPNALVDEMMEEKLGEFGFNKKRDFPVKKANRDIKQKLVKKSAQNFLDIMQAYNKTSPNVLCGEFIATTSQHFPPSVIYYLSKSTAKFIENHINDARSRAYKNLSNNGKSIYRRVALEE